MGCTVSGQVFPIIAERDLDLNIMPQTREDIKIPLTEREIFTLTKSWKPIAKNMITTGINMFIRMFETREEVKTMFEQFRYFYFLFS